VNALRYWVVQDHKENRRKCTAERLRGAPGVELVRLSACGWGGPPVEVPAGLVLEVGAPLLEREDRRFLEPQGCVVVLDATWARIPALRRRLGVGGAPALVARSLPADFATAYPRASKVHEDPKSGLATVEAMFAASVVLGEARPDFLDGYRWREEFLRINAGALAQWRSAATRPRSPQR
jgi:ribosome biogenesis protein Tsr3